MDQTELREVTVQTHGEPQPEDQPMLYCPVCSLRLDQRKCKLFCRQCGYYMSCADYY
jgi:hypothetical protein